MRRWVALQPWLRWGSGRKTLRDRGGHWSLAVGLAKRGGAGPLCAPHRHHCMTHMPQHVPAASLREIKPASLAPALCLAGTGACLAVSWHHGLCGLLCLLSSVVAGPHSPGGSWRLPLFWGSAGDVSEELEASRQRVGLEGFPVPLLPLRGCQVTRGPPACSGPAWRRYPCHSCPQSPRLGLECGSEEGPSDSLPPSQWPGQHSVPCISLFPLF